MVVAVETDPTFSPGNPELLFAAPYLGTALGRNRPWDLADDGRFLMIKESATGQEPQLAPQIVVVENWFRELTEDHRFQSSATITEVPPVKAGPTWR